MDFGSIADDFFVNVDLQTALALPRSRDTILHFFEAVQRQFPSMTGLYERETGEFVLESDRESGSYQWLEVQSRRLSVGYFNPSDLDEACRLHRWLLEASVYFLGVNALDIEALDVLFGFNLHYRGNRDAIVADTLLGGSSLGSLAGDLSDRAIECEPNLVVSLDEECSVQARVSLETRSNSFQVRTGQYDDEPISVYFTIRQYPRPGGLMNLKDAFARQRDLCEDLCRRAVIPNVIQPLVAAIASAE